MSDSQLYTQIASLPADLKKEVADFVGFLLQKQTTRKKHKTRKPGSLKGKIRMSADFDEPLEDFKDYM